jgi:DNA-binding transcriptional regulator YdaS (Cro superfamily)
MTIKFPVNKKRQAAIRRAVEIVGGEKACAKEFGCTFQAIQFWIRKGRVPAKHIIKLEQLSGVTRHEIDSDIYPESVPCTAPKPNPSVRLRKRVDTVVRR